MSHKGPATLTKSERIHFTKSIILIYLYEHILLVVLLLLSFSVNVHSQGISLYSCIVVIPFTDRSRNVLPFSLGFIYTRAKAKATWLLMGS